MHCDVLWNYLDKMDKNLLYMYALKIANGGYGRGFYTPSHSGDESRDELYNAETKRKVAYYLIWFVYRYILGCKTYEESLKYANLNILKQYDLMFLFPKPSTTQPYVYVGIYGVKIKYFRNPEQDIKSILYILYNRCDYIEQIEVYINNTPIEQYSKRGKGKEILKESIKLMEKYNHPSIKKMLNSYYERCKEKNEQTENK